MNDAFIAVREKIQSDLDAGKIDQKQAEFLRQWADETVAYCEEKVRAKEVATAHNLLEQLMLDGLRGGAARLGLSLQEYMMLRILTKLDDLSVTAYVEQN